MVLAQDVTVDSIKVTWPATGNVTVLRNVAANQILEMDEKDSGPVTKVVVSTERLSYSTKLKI